jgi:carboxymethylenebutenolidase
MPNPPSMPFVDLNENLRGYLALPPGNGPHPAVLVFQEAFGVNRYVQDECERLARSGYAALAPDFFRGEVFDYNQRETIFAKLKELSDDGLVADVRAAIACLDGRPDVVHDAYGAVGFCMGGRLSVLTAISFGAKIAAAASFYGGGIAPKESRFGWPILAGRLGEIQGALFLIYGADDESISPDEHGRVAEALSKAKKRYTLTVYPHAGHGFASTDRVSYVRDVAESAWARTIALFDVTLKQIIKRP